MANQIVNQDCNPANPQRFISETHHVLRRKVMGKNTARNQIKTAVGKGERQRVSGDRMGSVASLFQMRACPIEERDLELNPMPPELLSYDEWHVAAAGGDFEQRKSLSSGLLDYLLHQRRGGRNSAEPLIDAPQIGERSGNFVRGTGVGIEELGNELALHESSIIVAGGAARVVNSD